MSWYLVATPLVTSEREDMDRINEVVVGTGKNTGAFYPTALDKTKFKIGTLDQLYHLNDALGKLDSQIDGLLRKIEKSVRDIDQDATLNVGDVSREEALTKFSWDDAMLTRSKPLFEITKMITTSF